MIHKLAVLVLFTMLLAACRNRTTVHDQIDTTEETGFEQIDEMREVYYRFPSPDEMLHFINTEEIHFNDEIVHATDRASNYLDSKSQALNLGVYIADLAYVTLFERQKESLIYLQTIYGLSDKLRISAGINMDNLKKFEDNIGNVDSLKVLADGALNEITNYLVREDKERVLAIISIGGFVESLYLAFNVVDGYDKENMIIQRIADQKLVLENLLNYSLEFAGDKNVSEVITLIHPIRAVYNELISSGSRETEVEKTQEGHLIISGGDRVKLSEAQYNKLKAATFEVRKKIVENLEN